MKKTILLFITIFICALGFGQNNQVLDSTRFVFPEFITGVVTFNDGSAARSALNISTIDQKVLFISPEGEIQALANNEDVARVTIGRSMFIHYKTFYVEIVDMAGDVALGRVHLATLPDLKPKGAFGMESETTSISSMHSIEDSGLRYTLEDKLNTTIEYKDVPYLYRNNVFSVVTKKTFQKAFPDKKAVIDEYLRDHKVVFDNYEDVLGLFNALK